MKNILLIVDMQRGFMSDPMTLRTKKRIDGLISSGAFDCIIPSVYENYEDSPITRFMGWNEMLTEEEKALIGKAAEFSSDAVYKNRYSACGEAALEMLREKNGGELPDVIFLAGADTDCCVLATAAGFFEAGIRPVVLTYYCGSSGGDAFHQSGINCMKSMIGENNVYPDKIESAEDVSAVRAYAVKTTGLRERHADKSAPEQTVELLARRGWRITFAESCTGGLAASRLVDVPSASKVFDASFVTYANEAKMKYLSVPESLIAAHGVVSEEVALEMARGAAAECGCEAAVGISGIAGPSGAVEGKPVGTVCFGFVIGSESFSATLHFGDIGRGSVRSASVDFVYNTLVERLSSK